MYILGLWFQCQFSFQSLCNALQIGSGCLPPSGQSGAYAVLYSNFFGVLIRIRAIQVQVRNELRSLYEVAFPNSFLSIISQVPFDSLSPFFWFSVWGFSDTSLSSTFVIGLTFWSSKMEDRERKKAA